MVGESTEVCDLNKYIFLAIFLKSPTVEPQTV